MAQEIDASQRDWGQIALIGLGILLLLPGLCGTAFMVGFGIDVTPRLSSPRHLGYSGIILIVAIPSMVLGCLGLWVLNFKTGNRKIYRAMRWFGWLTLLVIILVAAYIGFLGISDRLHKGDLILYLPILLFSVLLGPLVVLRSKVT